MRFHFLFVQQYTNFLRRRRRSFFSLHLLNEKRKTYQQQRRQHTECIPFLLWCALSSTRVHGMMHAVLLLCKIRIFFFISFCSLRCTFSYLRAAYGCYFLELANTHCTLTLALLCLRQRKFQFYCTVCNLILLVYIINRWMAKWLTLPHFVWFVGCCFSILLTIGMHF